MLVYIIGCCFCVCISVGDAGRDRDNTVEAVDKISTLYFWQSHLAVDEEKRGRENGEERVIVMELSEVWECWMKWGPEEQRETKVEWERGREASVWPCSQRNRRMEEENLFPLNHVLCCFFSSHCNSVNMSANTGRSLYLRSSQPTPLNHCLLHSYSPRWLKL